MSEGMRLLLDKVLVWVESFEWYKQFELPKFRQHKQQLSESDVATLTEAGKFVSAPPLCSVKAFCVPEWDKNRKRPIFRLCRRRSQLRCHRCRRRGGFSR